MRRNKKIPVIAAIALGGIALTTGVAAWAQTVGNDTIYACTANNSGNLRVVALEGQCKNNETAVNWNIQGEPGPQGEQGEQGGQGPQGEQGPPGQQLLVELGNQMVSEDTLEIVLPGFFEARLVCNPNGNEGLTGFIFRNLADSVTLAEFDPDGAVEVREFTGLFNRQTGNRRHTELVVDHPQLGSARVTGDIESFGSTCDAALTVTASPG